MSDEQAGSHAGCAYRLGGPAGAPVLVLLGSLGLSAQLSWRPLLGTLGEQYRLLLIDLPGHGESAPLGPQRRPGVEGPLIGEGAPVGPARTIQIGDLGAGVLGVLDSLGLSTVGLAGISLGGMVGLWLAANHPHRIRRLAVLCSSARPGGEQAWSDRANTVREAGLAAVAEPVVSRWLSPTFAENHPELMAELREQLTRADATSYAACCDLLARLDLTAELARIAAATLVVSAGGDLALPPAHQQLLASSIAGAVLIAVEPAGHLAPIEQAGPLCVALLRHFGAPASLAGGYRVRREVLGDDPVEATIAATTGFSMDFQHFLTRYAWGEVWARDGLGRRERSTATLAALVALGAEHELGLHVRAALRNGLQPAEIAEVLLHTALYAGLPRANRAFAIAQQVLDDLD